MKTVTIGIPAYNEQATIKRLIESLLQQKGDLFRLERIVVACDGSTDKTPQIAQDIAVSNSEVTVLNDRKQQGKLERLNELFQVSTSDILIALDADIALKDEHVIEKMVVAFNDVKVGLVGGEDHPFAGKTFFEKIVVATVNMWYEIRINLNRGDNIHNSHGCLVGLSKQLYKKIQIPKEVMSDDEYLYLITNKIGYTFKYAYNAIAYYKVPYNFSDYIKQSTRYIGTQKYIENYFPNSSALYKIPMKNKIAGVIKSFKINPIYSSLGIMLQIYLRIYLIFNSLPNSYGRWTRISSTKAS